MKIKSFKITDFKPITNMSIDNLGSVVIIAGANGSGKTRLKAAIVSTLQGNASMDITIEATRPEEEAEKYFNGKTIEVKKGQPNNILNNYINSRKYGSGRYVGSLVQIDSNRSIQTLRYSAVNWLGGDPDDTESASNFYFSRFADRWQNFITYIHQKSAARDKKLADQLKKNPSTGEKIIEENPNPFEKYKAIFSSLLPGKDILEIDPAKPQEFHYTDESKQSLPFSTLSSGEQEVIKVLFDVAQKEIRHSVIIVDEPELHLHPTLTFKLIEELKAIGEHTNQIIFLTHSADLISTYYSTGDVYFIDSLQTGENQAHRLSDLNSTHHQIVKLVGQNLGLFAVGKKLVFVEGENSSIDRITYHRIAHTIDPEIKIIPVGSVYNILTLNSIEEQIRSSIFGIDIFMVRDRDGLSDSQIEAIEQSGRIRCLKRRHIENYFLDEDVLFRVATQLYLTEINTDLSVEFIQREVKRIAEETLAFNLYKNTKEYLNQNYNLKAPKVRSVDAKTMDEVKDELNLDIQNNLTDLASRMKPENIKTWLDEEETRLREMLENGEWRNYFQGKILFAKICSDVLKDDQLRIRQAYVDLALEDKPEIFDDLVQMFDAMN
ncbi:MAG: AAA family ATPase [Candidatus Marinimicrobia bacterium]|nr:AAA family ATPase [Candidatus Neomarinimicrobiota bacterium]